MLSYLYIALGGAIGSVARYAVSSSVARATHEVFPWGTLTANISGCFVIGLFAVLTGPDGRIPASPDVRQFVMVGICGGYTTFSSFSLQTLDLLRSSNLTRAAINVAVSVVLCVSAVALGHTLASHFNGGAARIAQVEEEELG